jgi:Tetratricopeptide repeat
MTRALQLFCHSLLSDLLQQLRRTAQSPATKFPRNVLGKAGFTDVAGEIVHMGKQETRMIRVAISLITLAIFSMVMIAAPPVIPAFAAGGGGGGGGGADPTSSSSPPPPPNTKSTTTQKTKKKSSKQSSIDDPAFAQGYRTAYATIYDRNDYAAAIEQLKALGHDDHPNVANLIGYSYRKLGDYKLSQVWYERALKADPNHVLTWQYYGLWQIEQGNRDQAQYHLSRIAAICGTDCEEYRSLAAALEKAPGTGLVY